MFERRRSTSETMLVDEIESTKIEEKCRNYVIRNLCLNVYL